MAKDKATQEANHDEILDLLHDKSAKKVLADAAVTDLTKRLSTLRNRYNDEVYRASQVPSDDYSVSEADIAKKKDILTHNIDRLDRIAELSEKLRQARNLAGGKQTTLGLSDDTDVM